jgi:SAM-dependent methyltransferase
MHTTCLAFGVKTRSGSWRKSVLQIRHGIGVLTACLDSLAFDRPIGYFLKYRAINSAARFFGPGASGNHLTMPSDKAAEIIACWATEQSVDFRYFTEFEKPEFLKIFWGPSSRFRACFFRYLDLTCVLEIASGAGRHAAQVANRCGTLMLVDTSAAALDLARTRFAGTTNIVIPPPTDGISLPARDRSMTAVYSYDAMVHFEPLTVAAYLREISRVLVPGGRALLHHSNYAKNPTGKLTDNPGWRNYMPPGLFAHFVDRADLRILLHQTFGWNGSRRRTDALTVVERAMDISPKR